MEIKGNKYGTHRVIQPKGVLTQAALKIDNGFDTVYSNEIVCDVTSLNIDSASFTQIENECGGDADKIARRIEQIVAERGKMQNPVTGSGGMFIGRVAHIGKDLTDTGLKVGDKIASLVSLSLTPLKIEKILAVHPEIDRVDVVAKAALFESGIYAKLPDDMPENLALAALDVAGAPAQTARLVKEGDSVLVLGAAGKSGVLVCYEAKKRAGAKGNVVGVEILEKAVAANGGKEFDLSINCVNVPNTEMAAILPVKENGTVYFFSMATSFTKSALGAEGVGKDVNMIIGNGYCKEIGSSVL